MKQQVQRYKRVFVLALPMVFSNITIPLLGLVDAAVIGHLEHAWYLGGVATGSAIISVLFWLLGFLRMSTTGLGAQAFGSKNHIKLVSIFLQGASLACLFSITLLFFHTELAHIVFGFSQASAKVKEYGMIYFTTRIWSAPAALMNLVIMGWLLGIQNAKKPMILVILVNSVNIALSVIFVLGFDLKVQGVAAASVIADFIGMFLGLYFVYQSAKKLSLPFKSVRFRHIFSDKVKLLKLNRDIFLRSLCLQAAFTFMTFKGATLGDNVVAANVVLMNFLMIVSFAMDGFAYAMEAMVGKAIGEKNKKELDASLLAIGYCSLIISFAITLVFFLFGINLINAMTNLEAVRNEAYLYLPWLIALPLIAMWCFLFDGVFIGAAKGREMRNSMFISMLGFFLIWWVAFDYLQIGNHSLWAAMTGFMLLRGLTLGMVYSRESKAKTFIG